MKSKFFKQPSKIKFDFTFSNIEAIDIVWYCEKKMIDLLNVEDITQQEFEELYIMLHYFPVSNYVAKEIWIDILNTDFSYTAFKNKEIELKEALLDKFIAIQESAEFVYKTEEGTNITLLRTDTDKLRNKIKQLIGNNKSHLNLADLRAIEQQVAEGKRQNPEGYFYTDKAYSQMEQDYGVMALV